MPSPVVIILAGGKGERFTRAGASGHKLDARIGADSVLGHVLRAVDDAGLRWHLVRPAGGTSGMGVSITQGFARRLRRVDGCSCLRIYR